MPDSSIASVGTLGGIPADTVKMPCSDGSNTPKTVSIAQLKAANGDALGNQSTADQSPAAATLTYITNSAISVPVDKLRIGTVFKWRLSIAKTAAGTAARNWHVRIGTAGTTADTAVLTFTSGVPTAVVDQGFVDIQVTIRGPLSASCIAEGICVTGHELQITGLLTKPLDVKLATSAGFDATVANLKVGLSLTTGAAEIITIKQCVGESKNL